MTFQTREQQRMSAAWDALTDPDRFGPLPEQWKNKPGVKSYLSALKKTPARIYTSGLGQALAFLKSRLKSRGDDGTAKALEDLSTLTLRLLLPRAPGPAPTDLLGSLRAGDSGFYFLATEEALAVCVWLTRCLAGAGVTEDDAPDPEDDAAAPETTND